MNKRVYIATNYQKNDLVLNQEQFDLIVGTLLADGNLSTFSPTAKTWRYRALQKKGHKPYLFHKYEVLKDLCGSPPSFSTVFDERTQKNYHRYLFNTLTFSKFNPLGQAFYLYDPLTERWVKDVPENISELLTPKAVAYMYMDDGSLKYYGQSNAMRICCESFSKQGVEILQAALYKNFQISTKLVKRNKNGVLIGYRLAIPEAESSKFRELIRPHLVDCMKYKVSNGKRGSLADD